VGSGPTPLLSSPHTAPCRNTDYKRVRRPRGVGAVVWQVIQDQSSSSLEFDEEFDELLLLEFDEELLDEFEELLELLFDDELLLELLLEFRFEFERCLPSSSSSRLLR
jgi:hypothetical protein